MKIHRTALNLGLLTLLVFLAACSAPRPRTTVQPAAPPLPPEPAPAPVRLLVIHPAGKRVKSELPATDAAQDILRSFPSLEIRTTTPDLVEKVKSDAAKLGIKVEEDFKQDWRGEAAAAVIVPPETDPFLIYESSRRIPWEGTNIYFRDEHLWWIENTGEHSSVVYDAQDTHQPQYDEPAAVAGASTHARKAWTLRAESKAIIGILDSGIDLYHDDLRDNLWVNVPEAQGTVGLDDDGNGWIDDLNGLYAFYLRPGSLLPPYAYYTNVMALTTNKRDHGTSVSSVIGMIGKNNYGGSGIVPRCRMMILKSHLDTGALITLIDYALVNGARILNCSWGSSTPSEALRLALVKAREKGVLICCATRNDATDMEGVPDYPAAWGLDNVIVVTVTTRADQRYSLAAYGTNTVDIGAPGRNILTACPTNRWCYTSGTSFATPMVSGAAALLMEHFPEDSYLRTRYRLLSSVDPIPDLKVKSGGRLNVARALQASIPSPSLALELVPAETGTLAKLSLRTFNQVYPVDYRIETSVDLKHWTLWKTCVATNQTSVFLDTLAKTRFYRAR